MSMDGSGVTPKIRDHLWLKLTEWCHQAVIEGYRNMIENSVDLREWEEEDISAALCLEMEELAITKSKRITVVPEFRLYGTKIKTGKQKA